MSNYRNKADKLTAQALLESGIFDWMISNFTMVIIMRYTVIFLGILGLSYFIGHIILRGVEY